MVIIYSAQEGAGYVKIGLRTFAPFAALVCTLERQKCRAAGPYFIHLHTTRKRLFLLAHSSGWAWL